MGAEEAPGRLKNFVERLPAKQRSVVLALGFGVVVHETFRLLRDYVALPQSMLMISDRGTHSLPHIARLHDAGHRVLCSAPWDDYRRLYDEQRARLDWRQASFLSIEQQRRRDTNSSLPK